MFSMLLIIDNEIERRARLTLTREENRFLRDRSDPFGLTNERFKDLFRLSKQLVWILFDELKPFMDNACRRTRLRFEKRILIALRFFASGNYQRGIGQEYLLAVSQPMVSRCVNEVTKLINEVFQQKIKFPNDSEKAQNKMKFYDKCGIPGIIGAIDCTHIKILMPSEEEHSFLNRKGYHSINVQLICDSELLILNANARFPGSCHDSFIWRQSAIKTHLENQHQRGEINSWLLGDSGYPLEPWLMTPVQGAAQNSPEARFNLAHASGRNCIERTNGLLKTRFRCLLSERGLRYSPQNAVGIIYACCILHNMCILGGVGFHEEEFRIEDINEGHSFIPISREGIQIRNSLIRRYFH